ncbi:fructose-bisphosphatase class II, partial [Bacillus cereus]|uniref:fructose-bisphosphatase class II n=1 Tax=Bacillus cereus TaxID=1396 RepID=UPI00284208D2
MLYICEELGAGTGPEVDIPVDPLEGTNIVTKGLANAMAGIAIPEKGNRLHAPGIYIEQNAGGPTAAGKISLDEPSEKTIAIVA